LQLRLPRSLYWPHAAAAAGVSPQGRTR